jgi:hypothetical protein
LEKRELKGKTAAIGDITCEDRSALKKSPCMTTVV